MMNSYYRYLYKKMLTVFFVDIRMSYDSIFIYLNILKF